MKAIKGVLYRVLDLRPALSAEAAEAAEVAEQGVPMYCIQSGLGHGSVSVTGRYAARFDPKSAAKQLLTVIEGGRNRQQQETGTKTGTTGGSRDMIRRTLRNLQEQGSVECLGRGPGAEWRKKR